MFRGGPYQLNSHVDLYKVTIPDGGGGGGYLFTQYLCIFTVPEALGIGDHSAGDSPPA